MQGRDYVGGDMERVLMGCSPIRWQQIGHLLFTDSHLWMQTEQKVWVHCRVWEEVTFYRQIAHYSVILFFSNNITVYS